VPVLKIKAKVTKELKDESRIDDPRPFWYEISDS
jgi:hypothetical protein